MSELTEERVREIVREEISLNAVRAKAANKDYWNAQQALHAKIMAEIHLDMKTKGLLGEDEQNYYPGWPRVVRPSSSSISFSDASIMDPSSAMTSASSCSDPGAEPNSTHCITKSRATPAWKSRLAMCWVITALQAKAITVARCASTFAARIRSSSLISALLRLFSRLCCESRGGGK